VRQKPEFEDLVTNHANEIHAYLWRMLGDRELAEDCLQDVFLRAFKAYARLDDEANFRAWLYKIATNTALSLRKREAKISSREADLDLATVSLDRTPHAAYEFQERMERVSNAVASLPDQQRAAIMLRKYHQLSYSEIAPILDCNESAARANVYQGLKKLRVIFSKDVESKVM